MGKFLTKIFRNIWVILLILFVLFFFTALSSFYTNKFESHFFRYRGVFEWGSTYERSIDLLKWSEKEKNNKGLILGSSVAYRNINPYILQNNTKIDWFNCASSSQSPIVSSALLKNPVKYKTEFLILDLYYNIITNKGFEGIEDWINNSQFELGLKYKLISQTQKSFKLYMKAFYTWVRSKINPKLRFIKSNRNGTYIGKGFVCSPNGMYPIESVDTSFKKVNYFKIDKLVNLVNKCKEKRIQLILVKPPVVNRITNDNLDAFCKKNNIYSIDFEKNNFISRHKNQLNKMYYDNHHMTCFGSEIYSKELSNELSILLNN